MATLTPKAFDVTTSPATPVSPRKGVCSSVAVNTSQASCDALDITGFKHISVKPPGSVTSLTFYGSQDLTDANFVLINDLGTAGVVTVTASVWTSIDYTKLCQFRYIQMKSAGGSGNAVVCACT